MINFKVLKHKPKHAIQFHRPFILLYNVTENYLKALNEKIFHFFVSTLAAMVALAKSLLGGMIRAHSSVSDIYQSVCQHHQLSQLSSSLLSPFTVIQLELAQQ